MVTLVATSIWLNSFVPRSTCLTSFLIRLSASCLSIIIVSAFSMVAYVFSTGNQIFPSKSVIVILSVLSFPSPVATIFAIAAAFSSVKGTVSSSSRRTLAYVSRFCAISVPLSSGIVSWQEAVFTAFMLSTSSSTWFSR